MAAVRGFTVMNVGGPDGTHPFFQNVSLRPQNITLPPVDCQDEVKITQSKGLSEPQVQRPKPSPFSQRPSNTHLSSSAAYDISIQGSSNYSSSDRAMASTPKKKTLKLSSNGKLLSSPTAVAISPVKVKGLASSHSTKSPAKTRRKRVVQTPEPTSSLIVKVEYGHENAERRSELGDKIDEILKPMPKEMSSGSVPVTIKKNSSPPKITHPFFLGGSERAGSVPPAKVAVHEDVKSSEAAERSSRVLAIRPSPKSVKPWKDIVFKPVRSKLQQPSALPAIWPPLYTQLVDDISQPRPLPSHVAVRRPTGKSKGQPIADIPPEEDVLLLARRKYGRELEELNDSTVRALRQPSRRVVSGVQISAELETLLMPSESHSATQKLKSSLATTTTPFQRGHCDQFSWTSKFSPHSAEEVLQPGTEAVILRDWIRHLTVNTVETVPRVENAHTTKGSVKGKIRSKNSEDMDGFIVSSDDEAVELKELNSSSTKSSPFITEEKQTLLRTGGLCSTEDKKMQSSNVILLSGPSGCGKTASVHAVARELGFEIFEINPGSRRSQKDILDKVGDMTQNHLVQPLGEEHLAAEEPLEAIDETDVQSEIASGKQGTMNSFFQTRPRLPANPRHKRKASQQDDQRDLTIKKPKRSQKQSLILLEEVDVLFDDDKTFWSGVMTLIKQSRRPIILTCNDESALPLDELPLHGILRYSPVAEETATDYLLALACSEGHLLERSAVTSLYKSKNHDLRASIVELDFWCQMAVGSRKGGLDWMLSRPRSKINKLDAAQIPRVSSNNTYLSGMGLVPHQPGIDSEQLLRHSQTELDVPIDTWCYDDMMPFSPPMTMKDTSRWTDYQSDLDLCRHFPPDTDPTDLQLRIAISLTTRLLSSPPTSTDISNTYTSRLHPSTSTSTTPPLSLSTILTVLQPLSIEKPIFPPSTGRLAPSLDTALQTLATDIAPYVRSIVAHEERWGMNSPVRKRATRRNQGPASHFPKGTVPEFVRRTGGVGWGDLWVGENAGQEGLRGGGGCGLEQVDGAMDVESDE